MAYIIAEAACSHAGDLSKAMRMVDRAAFYGCDAIKFQIFQPELIPQVGPDLIPFLKQCVWSESQWQRLRGYCGDRIDFMATPFDLPSVELLCKLGVDTIKIPSGRVTDYEFVEYIKAKGKRIIASTGMLTYEEVRHLRRLHQKIVFLHCTSAYPCPIQDVNLNVIRNRLFRGLSDHTRSLILPAVAVGMGAEIIEKHFTLSRALGGPDQKVSLEPIELKEMVENVRMVELALGDGSKRIMQSENEMIHRKVYGTKNCSERSSSDEQYYDDRGSDETDRPGEATDRTGCEADSYRTE